MPVSNLLGSLPSDSSTMKKKKDEPFDAEKDFREVSGISDNDEKPDEAKKFKDLIDKANPEKAAPMTLGNLPKDADNSEMTKNFLRQLFGVPTSDMKVPDEQTVTIPTPPLVPGDVQTASYPLYQPSSAEVPVPMPVPVKSEEKKEEPIKEEKKEELSEVAEPASVSTTEAKKEPLSISNLPRVPAQQNGADALKSAIDRSNFLNGLVTAVQGAGRVGAGLVAQKPNETFLNPQLSMVNKPIEDIMAQNKIAGAQVEQQLNLRKLALAQDADDPNSIVSKAAQQVLKSSDIGKNLQGVDNMTASQLDQLLPGIQKIAEAEANRQMKLEVARQRQDAKAQSIEDKKQKQYMEANKDFVNSLTTMRGDKSMNNYKDTIRRVDNALSIINNPLWKGNPDNIPKSMADIVTRDINAIIQGGVGSESGMKDLGNNTLYSKLAKGYENTIGNKPTGAKLGAFVKQNQAVLQDLRDNATKALRQKYDFLDQTKGRYLDPSDRTAAKSAFYSEFLGQSPDRAAQYSAAQEAGIATVMKANGIDRDTAIQTLKKAGKLPQ